MTKGQSLGALVLVEAFYAEGDLRIPQNMLGKVRAKHKPLTMKNSILYHSCLQTPKLSRLK